MHGEEGTDMRAERAGSDIVGPARAWSPPLELHTGATAVLTEVQYARQAISCVVPLPFAPPAKCMHALNAGQL